MPRAWQVVLCMSVLILGTVSLGAEASAKEGMRAWLMSPIPRWAAPGTVVHLEWIVRDDRGHSFNAIGVFVRLTSGAAGVEPNEASGTPTAHPTGEYVADVTVPEGGIGRIEFGIAGTAFGPNMPPRRSDSMFPVANLKWTPTEAVPDGLPPPDSVTNRVTSTSSTAGVVLLTTIPLKAREGTVLRVMWRVRAGDGRYDFGSIGMFVRVKGREEGAVTETIASPTLNDEQAYEAKVAVPRGGIAHVEFGIAGNAAGQRSDRLLPIVDVVYSLDEIRPADPARALAANEVDGPRQLLALLVVTLAAVVAVAVALSRHLLRQKAVEVVHARLARR